MMSGKIVLSGGESGEEVDDVWSMSVEQGRDPKKVAIARFKD